jgi:hypothetical protein
MTRAQFPQMVAILQQNMAKLVELYRLDPKYAAFTHVDLKQAGAVDAVDLIAKYL